MVFYFYSALAASECGRSVLAHLGNDMAYATVTMTGRKVPQEEVPGKPTSRSGHFEWTFILIDTREDFIQLAKAVRAAAPKGSMVHSLDRGEISVGLRVEITNDHELVQAVGNAVVKFREEMESR